MIIANPIYNTVFKYLLEDIRVARPIISTIKISELEVRPQERTTLSGKFSIQIYQIDFVVRIKTERGEYKDICNRSPLNKVKGAGNVFSAVKL